MTDRRDRRYYSDSGEESGDRRGDEKPTSERARNSRDRKSERDRRDEDSSRDLDSDRRRRQDRESKYRERSQSRERSHHRRHSRSPPPKRRRRSESPRGPPVRNKGALPSQEESFRGDKEVAATDGPPVEKQKPNYKPTGLLAKEANTIAGTTTVLKYHEPPEARKPPAKEAWRMYVFKKKEILETIPLYTRSVWLMGRDQKITDLFLEHPSISKQHAVIQFRHGTTINEYGDKKNHVKPYLLDLESANGTFLNKKKIEARRFMELLDGDVIAFGESERDYVLMLPPP